MECEFRLGMQSTFALFLQALDTLKVVQKVEFYMTAVLLNHVPGLLCHFLKNNICLYLTKVKQLVTS